MEPTFEILSGLAAGIALAAVAGLRAFLPLFGLGLASRLGLAPLGHGFEWLTSDVALLIFGSATLIECLGDKIPAVDHALDVIGTVIRPAAGMIATAGLLGPLDPLPKAVLAVLVGASVTGVTHLAKAKTRVGSSLLSLGVGNPVLSVFEDLAAGTLLLIAILAPFVAIALLALATFTAFLVLRAGVGIVRGRRTA